MDLIYPILEFWQCCCRSTFEFILKLPIPPNSKEHPKKTNIVLQVGELFTFASDRKV